MMRPGSLLREKTMKSDTGGDKEAFLCIRMSQLSMRRKLLAHNTERSVSNGMASSKTYFQRHHVCEDVFPIAPHVTRPLVAFPTKFYTLEKDCRKIWCRTNVLSVHCRARSLLASCSVDWFTFCESFCVGCEFLAPSWSVVVEKCA